MPSGLESPEQQRTTLKAMGWSSSLTALFYSYSIYTETQEEWEHYLPFLLFMYHTAVHSSTGASPFELMFGHSPVQNPFPTQTAYDAVSYQSQSQSKLAQLSDFVEAHLAQAANKQNTPYDRHTQQRH